MWFDQHDIGHHDYDSGVPAGYGTSTLIMKMVCYLKGPSTLYGHWAPRHYMAGVGGRSSHTVKSRVSIGYGKTPFSRIVDPR